MSVDRAEVARIAKLARLRLDGDEAERLTAEMNRILEHAERLRGLPAGEGGPGADLPEGSSEPSPVDGFQGVRSEPGTPDPLEVGPVDFAPAWTDSFFTVPPPPGVTAEDDEAGAPEES